MSEDRPEGTRVNTYQAVSTLFRIDPHDAVLAAYGVFGTSLDTLLALSTEADPVPARRRKFTLYAQCRLLGIVFLEMSK
jgi:hypothetical protein